MLNHPTGAPRQPRHSERAKTGRLTHAFWFLLLPLTLLLAGCQTQQDSPSKAEMAAFSNVNGSAPATNSDLLVLHEGDVVSITFPGAPDLNTIATIRRDGRITLKSLGEFKAAGLTPPEMEKELIKQFGSQLQTKEVSVAVQTSAFPVYVTGAVLKPGKVLSDRPITALEAIMEAGGFDYTKANLKAVRVLRNQNGQTQHFTLNFKPVLKGEASDQFYLRPGDIIYVPEKFTMF
ncbi:MAG TPA: polysaccharide biosynthesis/export family protein [Verrucomicrobiae bacterium]|nr:polysaccharide biosynthesis/export family protein [Verrucomicrobiae bacterium]